MPTGKQIRAARHLIDWTAEELAARARLTKDCILSIERGDSRPLPKTIASVSRALADAGVVFNGDTGVNLVGLDLRVLEGKDCYLRLLDDVFHVLKEVKNPEALFVCVDDAASSNEVIESNRKIRDAGIRCRYLASEEVTRFDFDPQDYRLMPKEFYKNSVMVIYENKIATVKGTKESIQIFQDRDAADMLRGLFEIIWTKAPRPRSRGES
jgi:transcriptional regulator with XRE-family HTH domain